MSSSSQTIQTTIKVSAFDGASKVFAAMAAKIKAISGEINAASKGIVSANPVLNPMTTKGLAGLQAGFSRVGSVVGASATSAAGKIAQGSHTLLAPLGLLSVGIWHEAMEIEKAKQTLQKSFLLDGLNAKGPGEAGWQEHNQSLQEFTDIVNKSRAMAMSSGGVYTMQALIDGMQEFRSMSLTTESAIGNIDAAMAVASIKGENLSDTVKNLTGATKAFFGATLDADKFGKQFGTISEIAAIMSKRLGINVQELHEMMKTAAPAARMLMHPEISKLEAQRDAAPAGSAERADLDAKILERQKAGLYDLTAQMALLRASGFEPSEIGNAMKTIGTRAAMPTPKAQRELERLGINPIINDKGDGFLKVRDSLFTGASFAKSMSHDLGLNADKLAPKMEPLLQAARKGEMTWWAARAKIVDMAAQNGFAKTANDRLKLGKAVDAAFGGAIETADLGALQKAVKDHQATPAAMHALFSMYHISKAIDLNPAGIAIEKGIQTEELERSNSRLLMLQKIASEGLPGALKLLTGMFSAFSDQVMSAVRPQIVEGLLSLREVLRSITEFAQAHPDAMRKIALGLAAFAALGPAVMVLSSLTTVLGALCSIPLWLVVGGLYGLYGIFKQLGQMSSGRQVFASLALAFDSLGNAISMFLDGDFAGGLGELSQTLGDLYKAARDLSAVDFAAVFERLTPLEKGGLILGGLYGLSKAIAFLSPLISLAAGLFMDLVGVLATVFGWVTSLTGAALGVGAALVAAAVAVGVGFYEMGERALAPLAEIWESVKRIGRGFVELIDGSPFQGLVDIIEGTLVASFKTLQLVAEAFVTGLATMFGYDPLTAWTDLTTAIGNGFHGALDWVAGWVDWIGSKITAFAGTVNGLFGIGPSKGPAWSPTTGQPLGQGFDHSPAAVATGQGGDRKLDIYGRAQVQVDVNVNASKEFSATVAKKPAVVVPLNTGTNYSP